MPVSSAPMVVKHLPPLSSSNGGPLTSTKRSQTGQRSHNHGHKGSLSKSTIVNNENIPPRPQEDEDEVERNGFHGPSSYCSLVSQSLPPPPQHAPATSNNKNGCHTLAAYRLIRPANVFRVTFFVNGDRYFLGRSYLINLDRLKSLDALCRELSCLLVNVKSLPSGVRIIFKLSDGSKVKSVQQFCPSSCYVCSSTNTLLRLDYESLGKSSAPSTTSMSTSTIHQHDHHNHHNRSMSHPLQDDHVSSSTTTAEEVFNLKAYLSTDPRTTPATPCDSELTGQELLEKHDEQQLPSTNQVAVDVHRFTAKAEVALNYTVLNPLGDGKFGVVYSCTHKGTGRAYALKVVDKSAMKQIFGNNSADGGAAQVTSTYNSEAAILKSLRHPNIVQLYENYEYPDQSYLVLELLKDGDMFDAIALAVSYSEQEAASMMTDLVNAVDYLHLRQIVHRDIKLENLMVVYGRSTSSSGQPQTPSRTKRRTTTNNLSSTATPTRLRPQRRIKIKLADFGLAVKINRGQLLFTVCGTPTYVAPEILLECGYSFPVDIWACGVIAYILLSGIPPFANEANDQDLLFTQIIGGHFDFNAPCWNLVSECAKWFIKQMLTVDVERRISAGQVLGHQWLLSAGSHNQDQRYQTPSGSGHARRGINL